MRIDTMSSVIFGDVVVRETPASEVDSVLDACTSAESLRVMLHFGERLADANKERASLLDSRATGILGLCGAVVVFLLDRGFTVTGQSLWVTMPVVLAALAACCGMVSAGLALYHRNWAAVGEQVWFPPSSYPAFFNDQAELHRWYIRGTHEVVQRNYRLLNGKAEHLVRAQIGAAVAGAALGLALVAKGVTTLLG